MTVWLTVTSGDGYDTIDVGPFDSEADARLVLEPGAGSASIQRDGVELDWWTPARGWEGEN